MNRETIQQTIHQILLENLPDITLEKLCNMVFLNLTHQRLPLQFAGIIRD